MCWEILTLGETPYKGMKNTEVLEEVMKGTRPTRPQNCPDNLWSLMLQCWDADPNNRPTFQEVAVDIVLLVN